MLAFCTLKFDYSRVFVDEGPNSKSELDRKTRKRMKSSCCSLRRRHFVRCYAVPSRPVKLLVGRISFKY